MTWYVQGLNNVVGSSISLPVDDIIYVDIIFIVALYLVYRERPGVPFLFLLRGGRFSFWGQITDKSSYSLVFVTAEWFFLN